MLGISQVVQVIVFGRPAESSVCVKANQLIDCCIMSHTKLATFYFYDNFGKYTIIFKHEPQKKK